MRGRVAAIVFAIILASFVSASAQDNPFLSAGPKEKKNVLELEYPTILKKIISGLRTFQRNLYEKMADLVETVQDSKKLSIIFILIGISFFYGVVHALGPGHGKSIAASYFLSTEVPLTRGLLMGGLIALLHAGSAIVVVLTLSLVLRHSYLCSLENINRVIRIVSHTLIASIGLLMFIAAIRDGRKKQFPIHNGGTTKDSKRRSLFSVALAVGIVPCPGAILILLFCLSMGILTTGVFLVLVMAIGMGLTISAVGATAILARQGFSKFLPENSKTRRVLLTGLRLFGSLLIFFIGGIFLLGNLLSSIG